MKIVDDRTDEEKDTYLVLIGGRDKGMSGWGEAAGGVSCAFWACRPDHAYKVAAWLRGRGDITYIRWLQRVRPTSRRGHCHIYVVRDGHPALSGE